MDKRTVLFIDDEEKVLTSIQRGLRDEPYNVLFARSGKETLEILQQQEEHVVVTDNAERQWCVGLFWDCLFHQ